MAGKGHEGWTNYETWLVNLHLTNNEAAYHTCMGLARANRWAQRSSDELAESIKQYVHRPFDELEFRDVLRGEQAGLAGDLLTSALGDVDWKEIADVFEQMLTEEVDLRKKHQVKS